jgi:hypothetical protein
MYDRNPNPAAPDEIEYRFQELRAQQLRAKLLFHCYVLGEDDELDDPYWDYYAEENAS